MLGALTIGVAMDGAVVMGPFVHVVIRGCHALAVNVAMWLWCCGHAAGHGVMAVCRALAIDKSKSKKCELLNAFICPHRN